MPRPKRQGSRGGWKWVESNTIQLCLDRRTSSAGCLRSQPTSAHRLRLLEASAGSFRRTHHALGGLLVPADRYFGRAEEVLACIESGMPPEGIGQPAAVAERQLDLFRISSHRGQVEIYLMGQRLTIPVSR